MSKWSKREIPFQCEGEFLRFLPGKDGKLKYLCWQLGSERFSGKIPKELRSTLYRTLKPGDRVQICGERKVDPCKGREKWVLYQVVPLQGSPACPASEPSATGAGSATPVQAPRGKVLVCQKSDCCRRGAAEVLQALSAHLAARGQSISVQGVGCMKDCKRGPHVVFMPDKVRYSGVSPQGIPALVERHFPVFSPFSPQDAQAGVSS